MFPFGYKGESDIEYYGLLSPDDGPELETCDFCGDQDEELFEVDGLILCQLCYDKRNDREVEEES